jgi:hypothetical protein
LIELLDWRCSATGNRTHQIGVQSPMVGNSDLVSESLDGGSGDRFAEASAKSTVLGSAFQALTGRVKIYTATAAPPINVDLHSTVHEDEPDKPRRGQPLSARCTPPHGRLRRRHRVMGFTCWHRSTPPPQCLGLRPWPVVASRPRDHQLPTGCWWHVPRAGLRRFPAVASQTARRRRERRSSR